MLICNISNQKFLMHNSFRNNLYTYQKHMSQIPHMSQISHMSQIPYLKTEDARDCTRGAQVSVFSFSLPKWKTKTYYREILPNI